jgi:regulatory protein
MADARETRGGKRDGKPARRERAPPRKITAARLDNMALYYLGRFSSSSGNLRRVLMRKVARAAAAHGDDPDDGAKLIEDLIARYLSSGLIDDRAYAAQKAASLQRRGASRFGIRGKLRQKGVEGELVAEAIESLDAASETSELAAACALARRRRLGPYRAPAVRRAAHDKDLATLARAGFRLDLARRVLKAADVDALESLARGEDEG